MAESKLLEKSLECPVCLEFLTIPIKQCVIGHSFCTKCIDPNNIKKCPECRSEILDTRNYKLEELLEKLPLPCIYKKSGCPYTLPKEPMSEHILECKHRNFKCEGKNFCGWNCEWEGLDIHQHFKDKHNRHTSMGFNTSVTVNYNDETNFSDVQIISAHYQLFWYKHKIDMEKRKAYWAIQYIGPRKQAEYYYYEFEIYNETDPIRRFKITEYCKNDVEDIDCIFESEKCIVISFTMLKTYVNSENLYTFRFRIMKKKKSEDTVKTVQPNLGALKINTAISAQANSSRQSKPPNTFSSGPYRQQNINPGGIAWLPSVQHPNNSKQKKNNQMK